MSDSIFGPDHFDDPAERPDPSLLVERDPPESRTTTRGWYLDPASNGALERYWNGRGYGWSSKTRGSGPLRRWFRRLPADKQAKILVALFFGTIIALIVLTGDTAPEGCQYGGGRFDYTC